MTWNPPDNPAGSVVHWRIRRVAGIDLSGHPPMVTRMIPDIPQVRPFDTQVADGVLTVTIRKEFDFGSLHQDWAHSVIAMHPGPYTAVRIDLVHCGLVSSTFFAGIMQLHFHYTGSGSGPIALLRPDMRVVRNLQAMRMGDLFLITPR